jgi:hypothetical protein
LALFNTHDFPFCGGSLCTHAAVKFVTRARVPGHSLPSHTLFFSQLKAEEQLVEKYRLDNEDGLFD